MLKVNNRNTRTRCEIFSKLTINPPLLSPLNINKLCSSISTVDLEQVNVGCMNNYNNICIVEDEWKSLTWFLLDININDILTH